MHINKTNGLALGFLVAFAVAGTAIHPAYAMQLDIKTAISNGATYNTSTPDKVSGAAITAGIQPRLKVKEASALDLWLEKLAEVESHGRDRIKILDVNGKFSYGCLQFQEWTFRNYGQKYGVLKDAADWESKIYDCSVQKLIAKNMIRDNYVLWQSWYTSVVIRDLGLPPRS